MDAAQNVKERRGLPCGGAREVARSYLKVHVRDGWTGLCQGCRDHYPCLERREAEALLGSPAEKTRRLVVAAVPVVVQSVVVVGALLLLLSLR